MHLPSADLGHVFGDVGVDVTVLPVDICQQFAEITCVQLGWLLHLLLLRHGEPLPHSRGLLLYDIDNLHFFNLN